MTKARSNATANAAKGDLTVGNGTNLSGVLAVGSNGDTIVADSSTATGLRYQEPKTLNSLINGGADIWQRGTSFSSGGGLSVYTADRWHFYRGSNAAGATLSRQTSGLTGFQYAIRLQRNSGNTSIESLGLRYTLESADSYRLAGKTVTLSFYLRKGADYSGTNFRATIASGTGTDQPVYAFTGFTYAVDQNVTPTTSWVRYSVTGAIPSNATEVGLEMFSNAAGTAGTNDYVDITGLQLEIGSVPTPFVRSAGTIQGELAACQRYYWRGAPTGSYTSFSTYAPATSTTTVYCPIPMPVNLRGGAPTLDYSNIGVVDNVNAVLSGGTWTIDASSSGVGQVTVKYVHTAASLTQYRPYIICANGTTSAYLGLSAEL